MRALVMTSVVLRRVRNCPSIIIIIIIMNELRKFLEMTTRKTTMQDAG